MRLICGTPLIHFSGSLPVPSTELLCDQKSPNSDITGARYILLQNPM